MPRGYFLTWPKNGVEPSNRVDLVVFQNINLGFAKLELGEGCTHGIDRRRRIFDDQVDKIAGVDAAPHRQFDLQCDQ